mmetsp:Transcript_62344/g.171391  ORF Transcript_62344/g.171391 Transcript_62344/m.171391 type:complete len:225 (-) Transcript_62344:211-885(-)
MAACASCCLEHVLEVDRLAVGDELQQVNGQVLDVLIAEAGDLVQDLARVVAHAELVVGVDARLDVGVADPLALGVGRLLAARSEPLVKLRAEGLVGLVARAEERVERRENALGVALDQLDARLVVLEINVVPVDPLLLVVGLLDLEDRLVELALEGLVGVVNQELLERVNLELLKAVDVKHRDRAPRLLTGRFDGEVEEVDEPSEHIRVDGLREGVPHLGACLA